MCFPRVQHVSANSLCLLKQYEDALGGAPYEECIAPDWSTFPGIDPLVASVFEWGHSMDDDTWANIPSGQPEFKVNVSEWVPTDPRSSHEEASSGAPSSGSQRPPEPAQPPSGKGGKGGKSSKGKESSKGKSKDKSKGKSKGKNWLGSDSESESSSYGPVTRHRPRPFDPVRHGQVTVIYENDNFLWNGGDRDRGWDRDVEHLE